MAGKWLKLFPTATRNEVEFFLDGEDYYQSLIEAIDTAGEAGAQGYVYILGWMLDIRFPLVKGDSTQTLYNVLQRAAGKGAEIRILIWDNPLPEYAKLHADAIPRLNKLPNTKAFLDPHTFFPQQSKHAIQTLTPLIVLMIRLMQILEGTLRQSVITTSILTALTSSHPTLASGPLKLSAKLASERKALNSVLTSQTLGAHHEKVVVVKGKKGLIAYCGGIDINKNRVITEIGNRDFRFPSLHDTACRLAGPAAHDVLQKFKQRWRNHPEAGAFQLRGKDETPPKEAAAPHPYVKVVGTYNRVDGGDPDRSLSEAYFKIIDNARQFIYIEDQYAVNVDVAQALNKKLKDPHFGGPLFIAIQDSIATSDVFIPNRKRAEFLDAILNGVLADKVVVSMIDRTYYERDHYHPGMHAKTLIVDDEIAIIGSANVNRRSFTMDSETSAVVFNDLEEARPADAFARKFRIATFYEFLRLKTMPKNKYESISEYSKIIRQGNPNLSILIPYQPGPTDDMDVTICNAIAKTSPILAAVTAVNVHVLPLTCSQIQVAFGGLWDNLIDPKA
ncbi:MAG: phospholipase D-like domain-containing protein [Anaerolineae bacterium]